jgi:hypothetical protein
LTAIAATVVLLPWAIDGTPEHREHPSAEDTLLAEQPLNGVGGGVTVREVSPATT